MRLFRVRSRKYGSADGVSQGWIKSSLSVYNGNCVEVAGLAENVIWVRNSRNPWGAVLSFTPAEWDAFIGGVHLGEFDRNRIN